MKNRINQLVETCVEILLSSDITLEQIETMSCDEFKQLYGKFSLRIIRELMNKLKDKDNGKTLISNIK